MIKWIYDNYFIENDKLLFIISLIIVIMIVIVTIYLVHKELREQDVNK